MQAQSYPARPIRVIAPFAAGGSTDIIARLMSDRMGAELGRPMIVENRDNPAAAAAAAARAAPDGYTVSVGTVSTMATVPACNPQAGYDPLKDFRPATNFARAANVLAIHPSVPAQDVYEFMELLRQRPGEYAFASSGVCSINHLMGALFQLAIVDRRREAAVKALAEPQVRYALAAHGATPVGNTPEQFQAEIETALKKAKEIVARKGLHLE
ncbi:hypothetical protein GCM10023144_39140 [Pigmentiphaga soli]|uniref:Tripartite tricarboxylate transporter substrate binding protein n=1 Tax=Pigmentiphaga soli TaxID=1007095 RepID=A0ABP8HJM0_9BURK